VRKQGTPQRSVIVVRVTAEQQQQQPTKVCNQSYIVRLTSSPPIEISSSMVRLHNDRRTFRRTDEQCRPYPPLFAHRPNGMEKQTILPLFKLFLPVKGQSTAQHCITTNQREILAAAQIHGGSTSSLV
jgi:hypothetical protein